MAKNKLSKYRKIIKICKWAIVLIIILVAYSMGVSFGVMGGFAIGLSYHNDTTCNALDLEMDTDGYCILREDGEYTMKVDCPYGKFKIIGEREHFTGIEMLAYMPQHLIYYPALRCKYVWGD